MGGHSNCSTQGTMQSSSTEQQLYVGTSNGHALWFGSPWVGHDENIARFLAGLVNLNEQSRQRSAEYAWVEVQLADRTFVVYPLALDGFGMFLAISSSTTISAATSAVTRLKVTHICSVLQASHMRGHLLFVLERLDGRARRQADRGTFADSVTEGSCGEDLADMLSCDPGEPETEPTTAYRHRCQSALAALEAFEEALCGRVLAEGAAVYGRVFSPLREALRERERAESAFCVCSCEPSVGQPGEEWGGRDATHLVYYSAAAESGTDTVPAPPPPEFAAAVQAYVRREQQGWGEGAPGKTKVLLAAGGGVPGMVVSQCCSERDRLVLALQLPADMCLTEGHVPLCAEAAAGAGGGVLAWPVAVLPPWLESAWQETLRRMDVVFCPPAPSSPCAGAGAGQYSAMFGSLVKAGEVRAVPEGAEPATPASRLASAMAGLSPASPAAAGMGPPSAAAAEADAEAPKVSETQTPTRVPAPPALPKSSVKGQTGSRSGRALRALA